MYAFLRANKPLTPLGVSLPPPDPLRAVGPTKGTKRTLRPYANREKGVIFGAQKTAGGSLGISHLAFREKGIIF